MSKKIEITAEELEAIIDKAINATIDGVIEKINAATETPTPTPEPRVYRGEDASEFGLENKDVVFVWWNNLWTWASFGALNEGTIWCKQPPAPKEGGAE